MLMPSPLLPCDSSRGPTTRRQTAALFASPPASPASASHSTMGNILNTCCALQSMLTPPPTTNTFNPLPTPPMAHATLPPPLKLRLRSRNTDANGDISARKKIIKRSAKASRGVNKRRRALDDDAGRDDDIDSELDIDASDSDTNERASTPTPQPSTPKRARIAPERMPLGLERADFHNLYSAEQEEPRAEGTGVEVEADGEEWSTEDDRILVEMVLEKLKLSKSEWQDCARSLGKDRISVGRRWKSLMINGDVGLKTRSSRRGKIPGTWR